MTEIDHPPIKYYVLHPDDNVDEFYDLFSELYPNRTITIRHAILTPIDSSKSSIQWTVIVMES